MFVSRKTVRNVFKRNRTVVHARANNQASGDVGQRQRERNRIDTQAAGKEIRSRLSFDGDGMWHELMMTED